MNLWFPLPAADAARRLGVEDPATGERIAEVPYSGGAEALAAVDAAARAFPSWSRRSTLDRADILRRMHDLMREHREQLAVLRMREEGAPLAQCRGEVDGAAAYFRWFGEEARRIYGRTIPHPDTARRLRVEYSAVGVVGAITPWNAPIAAPARKIAAALAAGCTMVLKPAELTPLCALAMAHLAKEAGVPEGVFQVVCGDAPAIGRVFLDDPRVRLIAFTGSTRTGRYLMSEAGRQIKRVALELGGNAPFVVFSDADLELAAADLDQFKFANSGQICIAPNRVLVERGIHARFLEVLTARMDRHRLGQGSDPAVTMGPLIRREAVENVSVLVDEAVADGARVVYQGEVPPLAGHFYPPVLLDGVTPAMRIANEEIFGPVAPVIPFDREEEALSMANGTPFGLAAYVYTRDLGRAQRAADGLEAGLIGINDSRPITPEAPFGGIKQSGIGREGGIEGLMEYLDSRLIGIRYPG